MTWRDLVYQLLGDTTDQRPARDVQGVLLDVAPEPLAPQEAADLGLGQLFRSLFIFFYLWGDRRDADGDLDAAVVCDLWVLEV